MRRTTVLLGLCLLTWADRAHGANADPNAIRDRILDLETQLVETRSEIAQLKADLDRGSYHEAKAEDGPAKNDALSQSSEAKMAKPLPDWVSRFIIKGDLRYRHEWSDDETKTAERNRNRIRARLGLYGTVNEEVNVGFRLASGNSASPTSTNVDLNKGFSSKDIWLDLAYFDYRPAAVAGLGVTGGKIKNPYHRVGNSDLIFDTDVNPEGIALLCRRTIAEGLDLFAGAGGFYLEERRTEADTSLWAAQIGATYTVPKTNSLRLTAGGGYFDHGNVQGEEALGITPDEFYGNLSTDNVYDSDFDLVQAFGEVRLIAGGLPLRIFADYVQNNTAKSDKDEGHLWGASLGGGTKPGNWQLTYNHRRIEADAILGVLAEATFAGGGAGVKGHKLSFSYQAMKNVQLGFTYMLGERTRSGNTTDFDVALFDLNVKF